jgi:uncharacterized phiE125 gp8 family phage protein
MRLQLIEAPWTSSPPGNEPLTVTEAKNFLKVDSADDDTLIADQIRGSRAWAEEYLQRALITQTWELTLDAFPVVDLMKNPLAEIRLPLGKCQSIISFRYVDEDGATQNMVGASPVEFQQDLNAYGAGVLAPEYGGSWPSIRQVLSPIIVRFTAGYGTTSTEIPEQILDGIRFRLATVYEGRGQQDVKGDPVKLAEALIGPYRLGVLG